MKTKKYFRLNSDFELKKISANINNTSYIDPKSKEIIEGTPEIFWQDIVFIEDIKKTWTHGSFYASVINKDLEDVDFETDKFTNFVPTSYNVAYNLNVITYTLAYAINELDVKKIDKESIVQELNAYSTTYQVPSAKVVYDEMIKNEYVTAYTISYLKNEIIKNEYVTAYTFAYLKNTKLGIESISQDLTTYSTSYQVPSSKTVYNTLAEIEFITSYALNDLHLNKLGIESISQELTSYSTSVQVPSSYLLYSILKENENVISRAIDYLNTNKVDKEDGKGLSSNDFTNYEKIKLAKLPEEFSGKQADWNTSDPSDGSYIKNKPTIPQAPVQSDWNETSLSSLAYIQNKPTIPAAQVQSDWNETNPSQLSYILNKPESIAAILDINYNDLVTLVNNNNLKTGQQYRIIDYTCSSSDANTQVATNVFDIIVTADATSKLNENARVCHHAGDTYFSSCNLSAWEIKYSLTNDTTRFSWASNSGKGVIYYMKDEFGNECGYDFKNMKFAKNWSEIKNDSSSGTVYCYTFSLFENGISSNVDPTDESVNAKRVINNKSLGHFGNNIINSKITNAKQSLNYNVFFSNLNISGSSIFHYNNTLKNGCTNNLFGNNCFNLTLGNNSNNNIIGGYKNDCIFNDNLSYFNFNTNYAGSTSYVLQNIHSFNGVKYSYLTSVPEGLDVNVEYTQFIVKSSDGTIKFRTW